MELFGFILKKQNHHRITVDHFVLHRLLEQAPPSQPHSSLPVSLKEEKAGA